MRTNVYKKWELMKSAADLARFLIMVRRIPKIILRERSGEHDDYFMLWDVGGTIAE